ncbi:MAG TPA: hypothetical protein VEF35_10455 [Candidatus Bathyarchaeia archaeon]|nr:hypothetical protein [Candidatus Bathyarchaeia archaeon]
MSDENIELKPQLVWVIPPPESDKTAVFKDIGDNAKLTPQLSDKLDALAKELSEKGESAHNISCYYVCPYYDYVESW